MARRKARRAARGSTPHPRRPTPSTTAHPAFLLRPSQRGVCHLGVSIKPACLHGRQRECFCNDALHSTKFPTASAEACWCRSSHGDIPWSSPHMGAGLSHLEASSQIFSASASAAGHSRGRSRPTWPARFGRDVLPDDERQTAADRGCLCRPHRLRYETILLEQQRMVVAVLQRHATELRAEPEHTP